MDKISRLRRFNQESYVQIAQEFDASRQHPWKELAALAAKITDGQKVLDLGCGNGRLLKALPKVNFEYTGIDSNAFLLTKAREAFPGRMFIQMQLEDLHLGADQYDHIFCIATFHHLVTKKDRLRVLEQCYVALKPGGQLIIEVWNLWQWKYLRYLFSQMSYKVSWNDFFIPWKLPSGTIWRYYHGFTAQELNNLFKKVGFATIILKQEGMVSSQNWRKRNYIVRAVKG